MTIAAAVVAWIFLAAPMATADEVQEQLRLMDQRLAEMEDRLQATSEDLRSAQATVEEQQSVLSSAGFATDDDRGNRSGISDFLTTVDFSGWVATSYNHRLYDTGDNNGNNNGDTNGSFPFHRDANTFALDQVWFVIDKAPTEESRAGFHVDLNWGKMNNAYGQDDNLYSAYVSYLAPVGSGVQFDAGVLPTLLGAEVAAQNANFNITRGLVYGMQPITHTGVIASGEIAPGLTLAFGVVNDVYSDTSIDESQAKVFTGQLKYTADSMTAALSYIVGQDTGQSNNTVIPPGQNCRTHSTSECNTVILDLVLTADPSDTVSMWLNADWVSTNGHDAANRNDIGIAVATRVAVTDSTGIAGRVEFLGRAMSGNDINKRDPEQHMASLTGTVDHALTEDLMLRGEARWDHVFKGGDLLPQGSGGGSGQEDQVVGVVELLYSF
jgi:hypothetical protein